MPCSSARSSSRIYTRVRPDNITLSHRISYVTSWCVYDRRTSLQKMAAPNYNCVAKSDLICMHLQLSEARCAGCGKIGRTGTYLIETARWRHCLHNSASVTFVSKPLQAPICQWKIITVNTTRLRLRLTTADSASRFTRMKYGTPK